MYLLSALHGHGDVGLAGRERRAHRVQAGHEGAVAERLQDALAHARHDAHVRDDVGRVGELDADLGDPGADRTHAEGDHVQRAAAHAAVEEPAQRPLHLRGLAPVVVRAGVLALLRADEGAVLDARHVGGIREHEEAVGALARIERACGAARHQQPQHLVVLGAAAVAPLHAVRAAERLDLLHPGLQGSIRRHRGSFVFFHSARKAAGAGFPGGSAERVGMGA